MRYILLFFVVGCYYPTTSPKGEGETADTGGHPCLPVSARDADGDGHEAVECDGDDCDDADATVNPSTPEVLADGVDNDCDGETDCDDTEATGASECSHSETPDDDTAVYSDDDRDGYTVADGDCDDTRGDISPREDELCEDGLDNDCDDFIDEEDPEGCE